MKKKVFFAAVVSLAVFILVPGCASTENSSSTGSSSTTFADYFSYPVIDNNGIAHTEYNKPVAPDDMDTLSGVLLGGYIYIEQTLNHYGYIGVVVKYSNGVKKIWKVERLVFDQFLNHEIDVTTFAEQIIVDDYY